MIKFPNCKINLGLNITEKRNDGFHNLETVFYPIPLSDSLEITSSDTDDDQLHIHGISIDTDKENNLVYKALMLLRKDFHIPSIRIDLHKVIPFGAGLGGGSSDASFMLRLLNEEFKLGLSDSLLERYASQLGSDCPFFIKNKPTLAKGRGEIFSPVTLSLKDYYIAIIKPDIHVSTKDAFAMISPQKPQLSLETIIQLPIEEWQDIMVNDFEKSIFFHHPSIKQLKDELIDKGAIYSSMSGSGASVYGIFKEKPDLSNLNNGFKYINKL
ncbi:MAG: 4-(cytidine 5'-diphospho)-2-C-methyl-D-erythritol kinase [Hyphomicrobiales bacterium]